MTSLLLLIAVRLGALAASQTCSEFGTCSVSVNANDEGGAVLDESEDDVDELSMLQRMDARLITKSKGTRDSSWYLEDVDVKYGKSDETRMDIYWPVNSEKKPSSGWTAVIILHGQGGTRKSFKGFCTNHVVPSGRLCASGSYRKTNSRNRDTYDMAMWFHKKASKWDVDTTKIVLAGFSLGGLSINNVLWHKNYNEDILGGETPRIRAVMLLSGTGSDDPRGAQKSQYVPSATFICSSDTDTTVKYEYSQKLYKQLGKKGAPVKFVNIPGAGHSIMYSDSKEIWYREIVTFLDELDGTVPTIAYDAE